MVTNGIKVGEYRPLNLDREVDIRIRFPKSERNIDQLGNLNVQTKLGQENKYQTCNYSNR